ncbi:single-stranded-DNA-specific exonuclease RecJ, partial [bacterium]|nr:single-stranded-DNA-specific exonuclease RecJ [bacterium]
MRNLLSRRGILTKEDAEKFLHPSYERDSNDSFLMHDMKKAAERLAGAIKAGEKIVIFGDYDCDGIPGSVVLHDFFKKIGYPNFSNYIPHRHNEGYGLNIAALEKFARDGVSVVVTVDCGIVDFEQADAARALGLDLIITDHHLPGENIPNAFAVVNPKLVGKIGPYPDPMLCGAGVAFKLVQALLKTKNFPDIPPGWEKWLLDMAGLSTIADMVPLQNENRMIAYYGLKVLRKSPRIGLKKLLEKMRVSQENLTEDDIGFMIAPRINAASRMDIPMRAFELLSTDDEEKADTLATHLHALNDQRKGVVALMVKEAKHVLTNRELGEVIVTGNPKWPPGLLGLAASAIVEHFSRPAFVWGKDEEGRIKGSCRSDGSVSVVELMSLSKEYFTQYGGHEASGGFMVSGEHIHILEEKLSLAYKEMGGKKEKKDSGEASIDAKLSLDDVNWENYKMIESLAPFGQGNPKPVFLFENIKIAAAREFGKTGTHLELIFKNSKNAPVKAIAFFTANSKKDTEKNRGGEKHFAPSQTITL